MKGKNMSKNIQDIKQPSGDKRRQANYDLLKAFANFEQADPMAVNGTYGNIQMDFEDYDYKTGKYKTKYGKNKPFYYLVSAPMLLARLIAAGFTPRVSGQDGYKVTYTFTLRHIPTGCILTFYDYKGASSFGACKKGHENKDFQADALRVIKALINPKFPHPYDGCVVGEIA